MVHKETNITTHKTTQATVFKRLMLSKGTERARRAYANNLQDFALFLGIAPVSVKRSRPGTRRGHNSTRHT